MSSGKRRYDDPCGVARALDLVGERWSLLVVRELLHGPKRFTDLSRGLPTLSQNVLSLRLRDLEQAGVVRRRVLGPPASAHAYELTDRGRGLEPVLLALGRWGSQAPLTSTAQLSDDAFILALKTTFQSSRAGDLKARYQIELGPDHFHAEINNGRFWIARGAFESADTILNTDVATLRALVFEDRPLDDALRSGDLHLSGDRSAAQCFIACFPRPACPYS